MRPCGVLLLAAVAACSPRHALREDADTSQPKPVRIILFIGDGVGVPQWSAARFTRGTLEVERLPVVGLVDTRSTTSIATDSAASATAYASGQLTYDGSVGMGPDGQPVRTVLEAARDRGLATGVVVTSYLTDATPAAFMAHAEHRFKFAEIAQQVAEKEITVLLGGGRGAFDGTLEETTDVLTGMKARYTFVETPEALAAVVPGKTTALLGLFAPGSLPAVKERRPGLTEMTRAALGVLDQDPEGFFLMIEASQPDSKSHEHAPLEEVIAEVLDLDAAVGVALEYRQKNPETLVVVVGDHETGGLALFGAEGSPLEGTWGRPADKRGYAHSAEMVPLFAGGPGTEALAGVRTNAQVGQFLFERVEPSGRKEGRR